MFLDLITENVYEISDIKSPADFMKNLSYLLTDDCLVAFGVEAASPELLEWFSRRNEVHNVVAFSWHAPRLNRMVYTVKSINLDCNYLCVQLNNSKNQLSHIMAYRPGFPLFSFHDFSDAPSSYLHVSGAMQEAYVRLFSELLIGSKYSVIHKSKLYS